MCETSNLTYLFCSIYRYNPVNARPALTNQQSFYDSHTSPPYHSPKHSNKPTLEHQDSFVAPQARHDQYGSGSGSNTFGFMPMRHILEKTSSKLISLLSRVAVGIEFQFPFPSHSHRISVGIPMGITIGIP